MTAVDGALLAGRYRLGDVLGHGGMSEVRRARDLRMGRWVAVKLLRPELVRDPSFEGRFRREAQSAASLHGPGIVAVYDTGEQLVGDSLTPYIVMELVTGRTLREVLAVEGRLPPPQALRITSAVCAALDEAHRSGLVHRDVKPGNVMLTLDGEVKVMDFGIARVTSSAITMTQTAAVVGTAYYLSPEQARGEHVDARSDVYSTGCLLYELLTGSPPFTGESSVAVAYQHVSEDPIPPSRLAADVTPPLDAVVLKALAKAPSARYGSAGELRADLDRVLLGEPIDAPPALTDAAPPPAPAPPPTTVLLREPPRRGRRGVAYLLLTAATLAVFVVALLVARSLLTGGSGELQTPAVVGQSEQDAQDVLNSDGLEVGQITYRYSNRVARGVVLGQNPEHPILLGRGQSVDLVVSKGVHLVTIPGDVLGQQASAATAELTHLGFVVKSVDVPSRQPLGQVTNAAPAAGTQVAIGSTVTLSVSNARQTVPGVVDLDATVAELRLRRAGFAVEERNASTYSKSTPIGTVVVQAPTTGSYAVVGSTVVIYVNNPLPPPSTPARHSSAPATSSSNTSPARSTPPASSSAPPTTPASSTPPATSSRPR